ncbi:hypothetical protein CDIK_4348 [Cucumispora dikerogammari]|nr:hypothetical protein CDIK_4348 [Cucumispora dikerogammari]
MGPYIRQILDTSELEETSEETTRGILLEDSLIRPLNNHWNTPIPIDIQNTNIFKGQLALKKNISDTKEEYFNLHFNSDLYKFLLTQINKRLSRENMRNPGTDLSNNKKTYLRVSEQELKRYIIILIFMGTCKLPNIKLYWESKAEPIYHQKFVSNLLSYRRFTEINSHFSTSSLKKSTEMRKKNIKNSTDKIITYLNALFFCLQSKPTIGY